MKSMRHVFCTLAERIKLSTCNSSGFTLPLVLVMIALTCSMVTIYLGQLNLQHKENKAYANYEYCIFLGQLAREVCLIEFDQDKNYLGTGGVVQHSQGGFYSINVTVLTDTVRGIIIHCETEDYERVYRGNLEWDELGTIKNISLSPIS